MIPVFNSSAFPLPLESGATKERTIPNESFKEKIIHYEKILYNQWILREFNYLIMVLDAFIKEMYDTNKKLISQMYTELVNAYRSLYSVKNVETYFSDQDYVFYIHYLFELCKVVEQEFFTSYLKYNFFKDDKITPYKAIYLQVNKKLQIKYSGFHFIPLYQLGDVFGSLERNICAFVDYRNFFVNELSSKIYEKPGTIENF